MDGAVSIAIRCGRIDGVCRGQTPMPKIAMEGDFWHAQGIERKYFCEAKDWSGKPGFRREAPEMRPSPNENFLCGYSAGTWGGLSGEFICDKNEGLRYNQSIIRGWCAHLGRPGSQQE
jgi:hypothetical protein